MSQLFETEQFYRLFNTQARLITGLNLRQDFYHCDCKEDQEPQKGKEKVNIFSPLSIFRLQLNFEDAI